MFTKAIFMLTLITPLLAQNSTSPPGGCVTCTEKDIQTTCPMVCPDQKVCVFSGFSCGDCGYYYCDLPSNVGNHITIPIGGPTPSVTQSVSATASASASSVPPPTCGGFANAQCDEGWTCDYSQGSAGYCVRLPSGSVVPPLSASVTVSASNPITYTSQTFTVSASNPISYISQSYTISASNPITYISASSSFRTMTSSVKGSAPSKPSASSSNIPQSGAGSITVGATSVSLALLAAFYFF